MKKTAAGAFNGRPLIASRVLPTSTEEFRSPTRRPANSVLSNKRLSQDFGVTLPDWRTQLQKMLFSRTHYYEHSFRPLFVMKLPAVRGCS